MGKSIMALQVWSGSIEEEIWWGVMHLWQNMSEDLFCYHGYCSKNGISVVLEFVKIKIS